MIDNQHYINIARGFSKACQNSKIDLRTIESRGVHPFFRGFKASEKGAFISKTRAFINKYGIFWCYYLLRERNSLYLYRQ